MALDHTCARTMNFFRIFFCLSYKNEKVEAQLFFKIIFIIICNILFFKRKLSNAISDVLRTISM